MLIYVVCNVMGGGGGIGGGGDRRGGHRASFLAHAAQYIFFE